MFHGVLGNCCKVFGKALHSRVLCKVFGKVFHSEVSRNRGDARALSDGEAALKDALKDAPEAALKDAPVDDRRRDAVHKCKM